MIAPAFLFVLVVGSAEPVPEPTSGPSLAGTLIAGGGAAGGVAVTTALAAGAVALAYQGVNYTWPLLPGQFGNILLAYELALPVAAIAGALGALWLTGSNGGALGALLQIPAEPLDAIEAIIGIGLPLSGAALGHLVGLAGAVVLLGQYGLAVPLEEGTKVFILWNVAVAAGAVGGTMVAASLPLR